MLSHTAGITTSIGVRGAPSGAATAAAASSRNAAATPIYFTGRSGHRHGTDDAVESATGNADVLNRPAPWTEAAVNLPLPP